MTKILSLTIIFLIKLSILSISAVQQWHESKAQDGLQKIIRSLVTRLEERKMCSDDDKHPYRYMNY